MNAAEFIFALVTVFGSTSIILGWNMLVYKWDKRSEEERDNARSVDILSCRANTDRSYRRRVDICKTWQHIVQ